MPVNSNIPSLNSITPSTNNLIGDLRVAFEHSYFNVLVNNIYGARKSSYYFDVDYSSAQFRPVNLSLLLSQSAAIATVQDSNYTSKRVISSRYEGSKTVSDNYQLAGRSSYGPNYTVDWTTPYFGVFEETSDSFPKGGGGSKLTVSKLVFKDGTIIPLDNRNSHLFDIQNIFIPNKPAYIYYTEKSGGLNDAINVETKSIDESGFLYHSLAFYKPSNTASVNTFPIGGAPNPYKDQEDNIVYYSYLNTAATASIYFEKELYGFNNLIAQKLDTDKELYFYYGFETTSSAGTNPYNSTGYLLGMGLILRNFYPGTGEQYSAYRNYPWIRFQWMSTGSIPNYNLSVNTDLLPLRAGDFVRVYDATEAQINDEVYSYDRDIFFLQNASGSIFQDSIYDSLIEDIEYTLPTNLGFLTPGASGSLLSEAFLITGRNSASIYLTADRFGDIPQQTGPSDTRILPVYNVNSQRIDINGFDNTLGKNIQFKKIYRTDIFTEDTAGLTYYKYWAIGTSGSLYRSEGVGGNRPYEFEQVPDTMIPSSCSFNAMYFIPNSLMTSNPNRNNTSTDRFYKRGIYFAVGDSGSIYASNNYGNTWFQVSFPRTDINLYDVFYSVTDIDTTGVGTAIDYIITIGSSGSIYMASGSRNAPQNLAEFNPSDSHYSDIPSNWFNGFLYSELLVDSNASGNPIAWPTTLKRSNLTFNRIIQASSYYDIGAYQYSGLTMNLFYILSNSGSIFYPSDISAGDRIILYQAAIPNTSYYFNCLCSLTGSYINSQVAPPLGYTFPASSNFIDGLVTGSIYNLPVSVSDPDVPVIKALWLSETGSIYFNNHLLSSSYDYNSSLRFPLPTKIFSRHDSASFNEMRSIGTINWNIPTPAFEPYIWIPTSKSTLLYQSASGVWNGNVSTTFEALDLNAAAYFVTNSNYPTTSFYSITNAEDDTGASSIYVKLKLRKPFPQYFYNGGGGFAYGVNPTYGVSATAPLNAFTGTRQAWRLYRKYSNEQYVLTKEYTSDGKGFIIPENYDPSLNYIEIAKKAGLIF